MSFLLDKLADANPRTRHPFSAFGAPIVCRGCDCDDDHACIDNAGNACSWFLIDRAMPTGLCSFCAEETGWDRFFFFCEPDIEDEAA